jgi:quinol monooxygenase YgiN
MLIIAVHLVLNPADRQAYLDLAKDVAVQARATEGCLDFVQSADPLDSTRINIFERWVSEEPMIAFRELDQPELQLPAIVDADVKRYVVASVEAP